MDDVLDGVDMGASQPVETLVVGFTLELLGGHGDV
jgi:hypothetical protein